jgi:Sel1 repeat
VEDSFDRDTQHAKRKLGKRVGLIVLLALAADLGCRMFHWLSNTRQVRAEQYVIAIVASIFLFGELCGYREHEFQELRGRAKQIGDELVDLRKAIDARFDALGQELFGEKRTKELERARERLVLTVQKAESGDPEQQFSLGLHYAVGSVVPQDDFEAVRWMRKAAEQGYAYAQQHLGIAYNTGCGVKTDNSEAYFWLSLSATSWDKAAAGRDSVGSQLSVEERTAIDSRCQEWLKYRPQMNVRSRSEINEK